MTTRRTFRLDATAERHGATLIAGSPLRLFRLTPAGSDVVDRIESGEAVVESELVLRLLDAGAIHPEPSRDPTHGVQDITVVMPALGAPRHVPPDAVVVDDGTEPPIVGAAVRLDRNQGPAAARNAGLATVTTPLVAFVDADVIAPDDWWTGLLGHFDDERVGLVAARVLTVDDGSPIARHDRRHGPLDLGPDAARVRAGTRVSYVPAAAIVARTEALRSIGGFDAGLRYGEDVDLVWRLDDAGWRVRYDPDVRVEHLPRARWRAWVRQRIAYGSSAGPLSRRHPGALAPVRMNGWSIASWWSAIVLHPALGAGLGLGSSLALVRKLRDLPPETAFRLAGRGNLHAGEQLALAVRRAWWPVLLVGAVVGVRPARRVLVAATLAARDPVVVADDVASSIGLWLGMWRARTLDPIRPEITPWPPRSRTSDPSPAATAR